MHRSHCMLNARIQIVGVALLALQYEPLHRLQPVDMPAKTCSSEGYIIALQHSVLLTRTQYLAASL